MDLLVTIMSKMRKELRMIRYIWINPMLLKMILCIVVMTSIEASIIIGIFLYDTFIMESGLMDYLEYNEVFGVILVGQILLYGCCRFALIDYRTVMDFW